MPTSHSRNRPQRPLQRKRKRSARAIETERKFLEAANEVFWRNGFAAANIKEIIDTSGQSVGSFYHQFEDKADLLARSATRVIDDFDSVVSQIELSRQANGDLFTLFYRLAVAGRSLVERNRGVYRALSETGAEQCDWDTDHWVRSHQPWRAS